MTIEVKIGDRFVCFDEEKRMFEAIINGQIIDENGNINWTTDGWGFGGIIYHHEIKNSQIGGNALFKVENEKHLLQLRIKYQ